MVFPNSRSKTASIKLKLFFFILILMTGFILLDVVPLYQLYKQIKYSHINEMDLDRIRNVLQNIYTLKLFWFFGLSGISIYFGYWILRPYKSGVTEKYAPRENKRD